MQQLPELGVHDLRVKSRVEVVIRSRVLLALATNPVFVGPHDNSKHTPELGSYPKEATIHQDVEGASGIGGGLDVLELCRRQACEQLRRACRGINPNHLE